MAACSLVFFLLRRLDVGSFVRAEGCSAWKASLVCRAAGWAACSLVFFLLRRLDVGSSVRAEGCSAWKAALVCLGALFSTLPCPFPPLLDELIKGIEMLLEISAAAPSRADVLMSSCSFLGIAATNTVRVRYNDK